LFLPGAVQGSAFRDYGGNRWDFGEVFSIPDASKLHDDGDRAVSHGGGESRLWGSIDGAAKFDGSVEFDGAVKLVNGGEVDGKPFERSR
jgi:hypothetical protein